MEPLPQSIMSSSTINTPTCRVNPFNNVLPLELQVYILLELDYRSILRLSQVNHAVNDLTHPLFIAQWSHPLKGRFEQKRLRFVQAAQYQPRYMCTQVTRRGSCSALESDDHPDSHFLDPLGGSPWGGALRKDQQPEQSGFSCYSCFKVKPMDHFSMRQISKRMSKFSPTEGQRAKERFCIACATQRGWLLRHGHIVHRASRWDASRGRYVGVKHRFCSGCNQLTVADSTWDEHRLCEHCGMLVDTESKGWLV